MPNPNQDKNPWWPAFGMGAPVLGVADQSRAYVDSNTSILYLFDEVGNAWMPIVGNNGTIADFLIAEIVTAGNQGTVDFPNIPQTFRHLKLVCNGASQKAAATFDAFLLKINGDGGAHYTNVFGFINSGGAGGTENVNDVTFTLGYFPAAGSQAGAASLYDITVGDYQGQNFFPTVRSGGGFVFTDVGGSIYTSMSHGYWQQFAAVDRLTFSLATGPFANGSVFSLYGVM